MNIRQLQYFVAVAEERHFRRAAERLHISQPPLSQQIKALEAELGCTLLQRTTRRVDLTPAGEILLERARTILETLATAADETRRVHRGEAGRLVLSFAGSATYALLPRLVRAIREALPDVHLTIERERLTPEQEDALLEHQSDLAVVTLNHVASLSQRLRVHPLREEPLVVALCQEDPLANRERIPLTALQQAPFLMHPGRGRSVLHQKVRALCHAAGFQPRVAQEVRETVTAVSLAAAGMGVAILPRAVQALRITGAVYRPLEAPNASMIRAIVHREDDRAPLLARVLEIIEATPDSLEDG